MVSNKDAEIKMKLVIRMVVLNPWIIMLSFLRSCIGLIELNCWMILPYGQFVIYCLCEGWFFWNLGLFVDFDDYVHLGLCFYVVLGWNIYEEMYL
jgi:hypothetical protein